MLAFNCDRLRAETILLRAQTAETVKQVLEVVTLANNVGMYVVEERVETQEQLAQLQKLDNGKGLTQGYLFSKPLALEPIETLAAQKPYA